MLVECRHLGGPLTLLGLRDFEDHRGGQCGTHQGRHQEIDLNLGVGE